MPESLRTLTDTIRDIDARSALDILLIASLVYVLLLVSRGTTAMSLLRGGAVIFSLLFLLAKVLRLTVLDWILSKSLTGLFLAAAVIFQPEIRRWLERVGRTRVPARRGRPATDALIDALAGACGELSFVRHGALMVLERETGLEEYIATGRRIDAVPSPALLAAIFYRNAPLHDGALIIRGARIVAAGCTLPLTEAQLDGHVGTRHRAGIGITERTDAVSVIVSEETGDISIAANGRLVSKLDEAHLRELLAGLLGGDGRWRRSWPKTVPVSRQAEGEVAG